MRYSLVEFILTVGLPEELASQAGFQELSIGGEGSYLDSISFNPNANLWSTSTDNTGSWVHNKNLDRSGTVSITINQVAEQITRLARIFNVYLSSTVDVPGFTLTLKEKQGGIVATGEDCVIQQIPNQVFGSEAAFQTWIFNVGRISFTSN